MNKFPFAKLTFVILTGIAIVASFNCHGRPESIADDTINDHKAVESSDNSIVGKKKPVYRGNKIIESDSIKIYVDYGLSKIEDDDVYAAENTALIRYVNDIPTDTISIVGPYTTILEKDGRCCVTIGVDTLEVNIHNDWPKTLNVRFRDILPGYTTYRLSKHYSLNDSARTTDLQINLAMSNNTPNWIKDYISTTIAEDASYIDPWGSEVSFITPCDLSKHSVEYMLNYYYTEFCKQYYKANYFEPKDDEPVYGEWFSYQSYIYPVWQSKDGRLVTWRFYSYSFGGGAHGAFYDYYLTFDTKEKRILNYRDLYSDVEFKNAMAILKDQINDYHGQKTSYEADLGDADPREPDTAFEGKDYPRPAITKDGIVFTYQTYEKGANFDGVLHFTQPYLQDLKLNR